MQAAVNYNNDETVFTPEFSGDDRIIPPNSGQINGRIP